jgi:glycosyltransferase involved in cell wall biosynthesis
LKTSIIIAYYKRISFLDLILQSIALQSEQSFEVIIAEDDNAYETIDFLNKQREKYNFPIEHVSHDNTGFRKNRILNKAILKAKTDYIIFIDGDCIIHKHFVKENLKNRSEKTALFGRRLMLSEKLTNQSLTENTLKHLSLFNFIATKCKILEAGLYLPFISTKKDYGILGCHWSAHKKDLLAINGYDEDYVLAGVGEDVDIEWRMKESGIKFKSLKFKAIQYHLNHSLNYTSDAENIDLLIEKKGLGQIICLNGILKK